MKERLDPLPRHPRPRWDPQRTCRFLSRDSCCCLFFQLDHPSTSVFAERSKEKRGGSKLEGRRAVEEAHGGLRKVEMRIERSLVAGHDDPDRMDVLRIVTEIVHGVDRSSLVKQCKVRNQCKVDFSEADDDVGLGFVGEDLGGKRAAEQETEAKCDVDQEDWHERENESELLVGKTAVDDQRKDHCHDQCVVDGRL